MWFSFPEQAKYGKVIPKTKFYEQLEVNTKLRDKFVKQVDKIVWQYKLAPETINISPTKEINEIQIFNIFIKTKDIDQEILERIDKAINFPIIFQIIKDDKVKILSICKTLKNKEKSFNSYLETPWSNLSDIKLNIPLATDLSNLYTLLLKQLIPSHIKNENDNIYISIKKYQEFKLIQIEINQIEKKITNEKQFNRKILLNRHEK